VKAQHVAREYITQLYRREVLKSLMMLWKVLLAELGDRCHTSTAFDLKTVERRVEHEGLSFLTITLPQFGKDFERSLETGQVDRQAFQGFSWSAGLPKFLSGFLNRVFNSSSGRILDNPDIDAIQAVRQLTLIYSKLFILPTKEKKHAAMLGYVQCDREVREGDLHRCGGEHDLDRARFRTVGTLLAGSVLAELELSAFGRTTLASAVGAYGFDPVPGHLGRSGGPEGLPFPYQEPQRYVGGHDPDLVPVHGPGATADRLKGNQKWRMNYWPKRLKEVFHPVDFLIPNYSFMSDLDEMDFAEPDAEIPVRVIAVPKTQKTPRIIAIEPTANMFMQKALQNRLYELVERDNLLNAFIGFTDQTPNQRLACEGSITGELATLDLSEASDRVSCQHVEDLCNRFPDLFRGLMAVRSTKADVEGIGIIPISKYASMGSALTFPIEAIVFLTMVFLGIQKELMRPLRQSDLYRFVGRVRVFGDDIVVPVDYVNSVVETLESFGLKVNRRKSFWTGKFRESCGKEYYDGHDVSIVRIRTLAPELREDAQELISWVESANQMFKSGLWQTTKWLDSFISGILKDYPVVAETSPVLGRHSFCGYEYSRVGGRYQVPLVKGYVPRSIIPVNKLDGSAALLKWFSSRSDMPIADEDHLERSGRPLVVDIKRGWYQPY